jgi:FKBP-type peptidyl-prolyl cis-trans isomerase
MHSRATARDVLAPYYQDTGEELVRQATGMWQTNHQPRSTASRFAVSKLLELRYDDALDLPIPSEAYVTNRGRWGCGKDRMMKFVFSASLALVMAGFACAAEPKAKDAPKTKLKTTTEKASYIIGLSIGRDIQGQGLDNLDLEKLAAGLADSISGAEKQLSDEEIPIVMQEFQKEQVARAKATAEKNKKEGDAFLAVNKKKSGITTTKSGLQFQVLKQGKGEKPKKSDAVSVHYAGTLLNGAAFDSSPKDQPVKFPVNGVIAGWTEALQLMPVGSKWRLFVPAELAYGAKRMGPKIGSNSTLIFEVELLGIENPEETSLPAEESPEN